MPRPDLKPPEGWSLTLLAAGGRVRNHKLAPDGRQIAFIWDRDDLSDVYVMDAAGGWPRRISFGRASVAFWADETPQWSPDGGWLAFCIDGHVHVADMRGGLPKRISDFTEAAFSPCWMPDGRLLVGVERGERIEILLTDRAGAWPRLLVALPGDAVDPRPAPDGRAVAFLFRPQDDPGRYDLGVVDVDNGQVRILAGLPKEKHWSARWSPDGRLIAFLSQRGGWNDLWLMDADGGNLRQVTKLGADVGDIAWSPDGTRLACTVNHGGSYDLAVLTAESGGINHLRGGKGVFTAPQWSPDGRQLFVAYENAVTPPDLFRLDVESGALTQLTFSMPPALAALPLVTPEEVRYKSFDGLEIPAFLYRPVKPNRAGILHPHGGPSAQYGYEFDIFAQYMLAKGYTFIAPNYRGSTGYGAPFERANYFDWGKGDLQDCLLGARFLHTLNSVDPARIAIMGGSYGGYMTALALSRDPDYLFAAGVSKYGDGHIETSWALCTRELRQYTEMMLGNPGRHRQVYIDGSPIYQVENIKSPALILHGLDDDVVPPEASERWVEALRAAGKTFEYKTYAGEPHGFLKRATQLDAYARIERFLDWHLMPPPASE